MVIILIEDRRAGGYILARDTCAIVKIMFIERKNQKILEDTATGRPCTNDRTYLFFERLRTLL